MRIKRSPGGDEARPSSRPRTSASTSTAASTTSACCARRSPTCTGGARAGRRTITMQVARNFFLTREKTFTRKLYEVLLAFKIEASLTKDQILELYINQIYLGQRAYGFAAAAQIYFGKPLQRDHARRGRDAGRPAQGAVAYNPVVNPQARASSASCTCCGACTSCGYITDDQYEKRESRAAARSTRTSRTFACTPSTSPKWRARRSTSSIGTTPTRAASASTPPSARPTRKRPTQPLRTGVHGLRPAPRLSRPEGYVEPAGRHGRAADDALEEALPGPARTATTSCRRGARSRRRRRSAP